MANRSANDLVNPNAREAMDRFNRTAPGHTVTVRYIAKLVWAY